LTLSPKHGDDEFRVALLSPKCGDNGFRVGLLPTHGDNGTSKWIPAFCDLKQYFLVKELPSILRLNYSFREVATHLVANGRKGMERLKAYTFKSLLL
jgi:hypothetical protein